MKTFDLLSFAKHIDKLKIGMLHEQHEALEHAAKVIEDEAKRELGTYQRTDTGPFKPWDELAPYTKADRLSQGYTENDPLLRSGAMEKSIERTVHEAEAQVGSNDDHAVYQELGTPTIPPRSFLGVAAFREGPKIVKDIGHKIVYRLT